MEHINHGKQKLKHARLMHNNQWGLFLCVKQVLLRLPYFILMELERHESESIFMFGWTVRLTIYSLANQTKSTREFQVLHLIILYAFSNQDRFPEKYITFLIPSQLCSVFFQYYILLRKDRDLHLFTLPIVSCHKQMCQPVTLNKGGEKENEAAQRTSTLQHPERWQPPVLSSSDTI